jgi:hypothetical protein
MREKIDTMDDFLIPAIKGLETLDTWDQDKRKEILALLAKARGIAMEVMWRL